MCVRSHSTFIPVQNYELAMTGHGLFKHYYDYSDNNENTKEDKSALPIKPWGTESYWADPRIHILGPGSRKEPPVSQWIPENFKIPENTPTQIPKNSWIPKIARSRKISQIPENQPDPKQTK